MLSSSGEGWPEEGTAQGLAGHWSVGGEQLFFIASLVFLGVYFSLFLLFPILLPFLMMIIIVSFKLLNCSFLNP